MDEMKIKLTTTFMRGIVSRIIAKKAKELTGVEPDVRIDEISLTQKDGTVNLHISMDGSITTDALKQILGNFKLL